MHKLKQFELPLYNINFQEYSNCRITIYENDRERLILEFEHKLLDKQKFQANDFFDCLCDLRLFLEKERYFILCNGARVDCYPSPMARDMGMGLKVYQMKMGQKAQRTTDLLKTFDRAEISQIGTVEEQRTYFEKWLVSLGWKKEWLNRRKN
ncbi:hypothetical protein IQ235_09040 [Oscillatoriales cyanobacterium LEGE 11467]|uniref:Uncharacterized protein n=1 Tax=Zarconia navalis LEGE 11467 TaxID=1828826 RepID=A0A928VX65_9CYAN|nr:hypothetical protein [Zarconia navalis]MBE9040923.1 hypothetical protein [Zarconia navalis LEGE 11467]